jgi:hypothetical protein
MTNGWWLVAAVGLGSVGLVQAALFWWAARALRSQQRLEERVAHLSDALALLTETAESGFRATATELTRISASGVASAGRSRTAGTRVTRAPRRGKSIPQIAAEEEMSESEVRLRLHLRNQAACAAGE